MSIAIVMVAWIRVVVMEQKWIFLEYPEIKESTGWAHELCVVLEDELKKPEMTQKVLVWPLPGNVIIYYGGEERTVGRIHYFCFRHVDFVMTLNRYLSRDGIAGSWGSEKRSSLKRCWSHRHIHTLTFLFKYWDWTRDCR